MRLEWQQNTQRRYESGVDRGVLYPKEGPGVPWNGLMTVEESFIGGKVEPYYFDGIKYLEKRAAKHFQATITAFTAPKEFAPCIGERSVVPGFILTRQPRQRFGFSYRTLINDGSDYKIHVVYNATATPESRGYSTKSADVSPTNFSWKVDAVPPLSDTFRPSAHFTLDTTKTDLFTLRAIEDILYGTEFREPRLPSAEELVDIVGLWEPKLIVPAAEPPETKVNLSIPSLVFGNPNAGLVALGQTTGNRGITPDYIWGEHSWFRVGANPSGNNPIIRNYLLESLLTDNTAYSVGVGLANPSPTDQITVKVDWCDYGSTTVILGPGEETRVELPPINRGDYNSTYRFSDAESSSEFLIRDWNVIEGSIVPYFNGDTPDDLEYTYSWSGTPSKSTSIRKSQRVAHLTPGLGDLSPSRTPGLYRELPTTRLVKSAVGGLYRLE